MSHLWASNNKEDWIGNITTSSSNVDLTKVPYSFAFNDDNDMMMRSNHKKSSTSETWYHFRFMWNTGGAGVSEDGYMWTIYDETGKFLTRLDVFNATIAMAISGDGTTWDSGTYYSNFTAGLHDMDIKVDVTGSLVTVELYVDQILHSFGTRTIANTGSLTVARRLQIGPRDAMYVTAGQGVFISEIIVSETDTRGLRLNMISPTGVGAHTDWSGTVADLFDEDIGTGMYSNLANELESLVIGSYGGGTTISAVMVTSIASRAPTGPQALSLFLRKSATDYLGEPTALEVISSLQAEVWEDDPNTSLPWVDTDISSLEIGFKSIAVALPMESASFTLTGNDIGITLA